MILKGLIIYYTIQRNFVDTAGPVSRPGPDILPLIHGRRVMHDGDVYRKILLVYLWFNVGHVIGSQMVFSIISSTAGVCRRLARILVA